MGCVCACARLLEQYYAFLRPQRYLRFTSALLCAAAAAASAAVISSSLTRARNTHASAAAFDVAEDRR
jgi:hypothetical protein